MSLRTLHAWQSVCGSADDLEWRQAGGDVADTGGDRGSTASLRDTCDDTDSGETERGLSVVCTRACNKKHNIVAS